MKQERSADRRKYHVIYKTTCKISGRYYVGMHSTDNLADGYIGSGKRLWQSIKKHGVEQHVCEVLEHLPSRDALRLREAELVNEQLLSDHLCMNIAFGGDGGWEHCNAKLTHEQRYQLGLAGGAATKLAREADPEKYKHLNELAVKIMTATASKQWQSDREQMLEWQQNATKHAASEAAKSKRNKTFAAIAHQSGAKNSQYGKCWVQNGQHSLSIKKEELEQYLTQGYVRGRMPV